MKTMISYIMKKYWASFIGNMVEYMDTLTMAMLRETTARIQTLTYAEGEHTGEIAVLLENKNSLIASKSLINTYGAVANKEDVQTAMVRFAEKYGEIIEAMSDDPGLEATMEASLEKDTELPKDHPDAPEETPED